jgi:hypothetical protein
LQYGQTAFSKSLSAPYSAAFGADELRIVPLLGLVNSSQDAPMSIVFRPLASAVSFENQAEAVFFVRDPEEMFQSLRSRANDDLGWQYDTTGCAGGGCPRLPVTPFAFSAASPNGGGGGASFAASAPVFQATFWNGTTPRAPGADPRGLSSIKATRVYQHGLCSYETPIADIIGRINQSYLDQFFDPNGSVCNAGAIVPINGNIDYSNLTSYLSHSEGSLEDLRGGFLFASALSVFDQTGTVDTCALNFNVNYEFGLIDGRVGVPTGNINSFSTSSRGAICSQVEPAIYNALLHDIPDQILGTADSLQIYPQDFNDTQFDGCEPDPNKNPNPCAAHPIQLEVGIRLGADRAGLSLSEAQQVVDQLRQTDSNGTLVNWRCVNRPVEVESSANPTAICLEDRYRCEYILRAKRLNVFPDSLEIVWFDDARDFSAPALPIYYLSLAQGPTSPLCRRQPSIADPSLTNPFGAVIFNRAFANIHSFGRLGCGDAPPPPPPLPKCGM